MMKRQLLACFVTCTLVGAGLNHAEQPPLGGPVDQYGDLLPPGAVARLGTVRLRVNHLNGVSFSADGKQLVACGHTSTVSAWDVETARPLPPYLTDPAGEWLMSVRHSPDGKYLAAVGDRGEVWVWDAESRRQLWTVAGHEDRTYAIAYHPDGKTLATAGGGNKASVRLWNLADGEPIDTIEIAVAVHDDCPLDFSPDGTKLAYAARNNIYLYDLERSQPLRTIERAFRQEVSSLCFVDDGDALLAAGGRIVRLKEPKNGSGSEVQALLRRFDVATGKKLADYPAPELHELEPRMLPLPGRESLLYIAREGVYVISAKNAAIKSKWPQPANTSYLRTGGVALQPSGSLIAHQRNDELVLLDVQTGHRLHDHYNGHHTYVIGLATSPDGKRAVTGSASGEVFEWEADTGKFLRQFPGTEGWVRCLKYTPDGGKLIVAGEALNDAGRFCGEVLVCETKSGEKLWGREVADRVMALGLSDDGQQMALAEGLGRMDAVFGDGDGKSKIEILRVDTGEVLQQHEAEKYPAKAIGFLGGGELIRMIDERGKCFDFPASTSAEPSTNQLWNLKSAAKLRPLTAPTDMSGLIVSSMEYPTNVDMGSRLWYLQRKGSVQLIDTTTGQVRWSQPIGHEYCMRGAFSPDGRLVALEQQSPRESRGDLTITIRSVETGDVLWALPLEDGQPFSLSFSADGRRLLTGNNRGDAMVWDLSLVPDSTSAAPPSP